MSNNTARYLDELAADNPLDRLAEENKGANYWGDKFSPDNSASRQAETRGAEKSSTKKVILPPLATFSAANRYAGKPPPRDYIINRVLERKQTMLFAAQGGVGKTFKLLEIATQVAELGAGGYQSAAPPVLGGYIEKGGSAVILTAEDPADEVHRRIDAIASNRPDNLIVVPLSDPAINSSTTTFFTIDQKGDVEATPLFSDIAEKLRGMSDLALFCIDPLQTVCAFDLNSNGYAQSVCSFINKLAVETNSAAIITHHFRKEKDESATVAEARQLIRGASGLVDGVRVAYVLFENVKESEKIAKALGTKNQIVFGGVAKANGPAPLGRHVYKRANNGLLIDRTADARRADSNGSNEELIQLLTACVAIQANKGHPYTKTGVNGLYNRRGDLPDPFRKMTRQKLASLAEQAISKGTIVQADINGGRSSFLDADGGAMATAGEKIQPKIVTIEPVSEVEILEWQSEQAAAKTSGSDEIM